MATKKSRRVIPEAKQGLYNFRTEIAKEMGVPFTEYNGGLTSKECGIVGGEMVKRMVTDFEAKIKK